MILDARYGIAYVHRVHNVHREVFRRRAFFPLLSRAPPAKAKTEKTQLTHEIIHQWMTAARREVQLVCKRNAGSG